MKTAAAKSSKKRVGNIVSGKRANIFNYFGTAQKGKLCVAQKMKMDTLISDINDINSSKENENPSNLDKTVETSNIIFKEKKFEGKCSSKTCGSVPLDTKKVISKSIKRVFNDENFDNVENKKPKIGDRNHVVDLTIKITSQAADEVLISNTKMKNEIYGLFKKVFNDLDPSKVHNYYFCTEKNCKEICSADLKAMSKDNKFQHKWLFDPSYSFCENTTKWNLVYIEGEGMFFAVCRKFDAKQKKKRFKNME